jgi:hypothetical protein
VYFVCGLYTSETQGSTPEQLAAEMTRTLSAAVVYQSESAEQIDLEWRKTMEQLQQEEEMEKKSGNYDYASIPSQQMRLTPFKE